MEQMDLPFEGPILQLLTPDEIYANAGLDLLRILGEDRRSRENLARLIAERSETIFRCGRTQSHRAV
jgi:hypothetical protein